MGRGRLSYFDFLHAPPPLATPAIGSLYLATSAMHHDEGELLESGILLDE
jgi:hypothetical protein